MKKTFLSVLSIALVFSLLFVKQPVHADIYSQYKSVSTAYWDWPSRDFSLTNVPGVTLTKIGDGSNGTQNEFYSSFAGNAPVVDELRDNGYAVVPLGFTYTFNGTQFDTIYVSINGFATFGNSVDKEPPFGSDITRNPQLLFNYDANYPSNVLAPFWNDHKYWSAQDIADAKNGIFVAGCDKSNMTPSSISYVTLETTRPVEEGGVIVDKPVNACIIQWENINANWRTGNAIEGYIYNTGNVVSFQLIIYQGVGEGDEMQGDVEFRYGRHGSVVDEGSGEAPEESPNWFHAAIGAKGEISRGYGKADFINALYNNNVGLGESTEWLDLDKQRTSERINRGWSPSGDPSRAILLTANPWSGGDESWGDGDANMSRIDPTSPHYESTDTRRFVTISDIIAILRSVTTDNKLDPDYKQAAFHADVHHDGRYYYIGDQMLYALYRNDNMGVTDRVAAQIVPNNLVWAKLIDAGISDELGANTLMAGNARISKDTFYLKKVLADGQGGFSQSWGTNDEYVTIDLRKAIDTAVASGDIAANGRYSDYRAGNSTEYTVDYNSTVKVFKVVDLSGENETVAENDYQLRITLENATDAEKSLLWILTGTPYQTSQLYTFKLRKNVWWSDKLINDNGPFAYVADTRKELLWEADEYDASVILAYLGGKVIGLPWWEKNTDHDKKDKAVAVPYKLADNVIFDNAEYSADNVVIPVYYNGIAPENQAVSFTFNGNISDVQPANSDVMVSYDNSTHKLAIISDGYFSSSSPVAYITLDKEATSFEATRVKFCGKRTNNVSLKLKNNVTAGNSDVLAYNQPNPAINYTDFVVDIATSGNYKLTVFDVSGNPVKVVANGTFAAGRMDFNWDITNETGDKVANGTYFYTLEGDNVLITKSLVIAR